MENKLQLIKEDFKEKVKQKINEAKVFIKPFICIVIIFAIAITAIIRANIYYIDDAQRAAEGVAGWINFSRYVTEFLSTFIHCDTYLTDISPLPQLLAICIMAIAGVIVIYVYKGEKKFSVWDIIAIIPFGLSPYFLECLSYKYDAPYMALSVLVSVLPLLFRKKKKTIYSIIVILCTLIMCMTYQASSGIFLMISLLLFLKSWNEKEDFDENSNMLTLSIVSYMIGLIIFKIFIMQPAKTYVSNQIFPLAELIPGTLGNLYKYFSTVVLDLKKEWLIIIGLMAVAFVYIFARDSKQKKYVAIPVTIIVLLLMAVLCFGMYPVLVRPSFVPRGMYGFGVFVSLIGVAIASAKKMYPGKIAVFALSWIFFVFAFTYGNALDVQDEYTKFRMNMVLQDLNELEVCNNGQTKVVQITGTIGQSPVLENMRQDYQILNKLVPMLFNGNWMWGNYYFLNYYDIQDFEIDRTKRLEREGLPILKDTMYHKIQGNDSFIWIRLK